MKKVISGPVTPVQDTIYIPSSKSISNRMLVIRALGGSEQRIHNLSESDDTRVLRLALEDPSPIKDVGHAGTAMRFLAAYHSFRPGEVILTGSERMKERPMGPLVDALRELGARIGYQGREGSPPLKISGGGLRGGELIIDGGISSQFISALMMIAPLLPGGLQISLSGRIVSPTYISMTVELMNRYGAEASFQGNRVHVPEGAYRFVESTVEADWSGASYWYQVAALLPGSAITMPHLREESIQGDAVVIPFFRNLGVESRFHDGGVTIRSLPRTFPGRVEHDFTGCPDLVQTCAVTLCALGVPFWFTGTSTLKVKETDRIEALKSELGKAGFLLDSHEAGEWISWDGSRCRADTVPSFLTYHDHRMAMAFAPLAITLGRIHMEDPMVVTKSYPGYWKDLEQAGFSMEDQF